jgi:hypothetical protein
VIHNNNLLIRVVNKSRDSDKITIQVRIEAVLEELHNQDTHTKAKIVKEKITTDAVDLAHYVMGLVNTPPVQLSEDTKHVLIAGLLGLVVGAVTYYTVRRF